MSDELTIEDFRRITCNPFYAITIHPGMFGEHEPMVSKGEWATIMARNILEDENGIPVPPELIEASIKEWMLRMLDVLEGNYA